jgi:ankyrin repeat protein
MLDKYIYITGLDDIVELLVTNKANVNAQMQNGTTSLMLACEHVSLQ